MSATAETWGERFTLATPLYERKIRTYSKIHFREIAGYEQNDLENDLLEVLWLACRHYDPDHGATFNTFFWELVKRRFLDMLKKERRLKRGGGMIEMVSLDEDAIRAVAAEIRSDPSAEEEALARINVQKRWESR